MPRSIPPGGRPTGLQSSQCLPGTSRQPVLLIKVLYWWRDSVQVTATCTMYPSSLKYFYREDEVPTLHLILSFYNNTVKFVDSHREPSPSFILLYVPYKKSNNCWLQLMTTANNVKFNYPSLEYTWFWLEMSLDILRTSLSKSNFFLSYHLQDGLFTASQDIMTHAHDYGAFMHAAGWWMKWPADDGTKKHWSLDRGKIGGCQS